LDIGSQYRSAIFYHSDKQKTSSEKSLQRLEETARFKDKVVTEIVPAGTFYRAEEYHQQYLKKNRKNLCKIF